MNDNFGEEFVWIMELVLMLALVLVAWPLRWVCYFRGYHTSPGQYGWRFLTGGFRVYCGTCGWEISLRTDNVKKDSILESNGV